MRKMRKTIKQRINALEKESVALEKQLQEQPTVGGGKLENKLGSLTAHLVHCLNLFN